MPRRSAWMERLPYVRQRVEDFPAEWVDRQAMEDLFDVQPRRALQLMQAFGAQLAGGALIVARQSLLAAVAKLESSEEARLQFARRRRLARRLAETHRQWQARRITLPQPSAPPGPTLADLPGNVTLESNRLEVRFESPMELLSTLYSLVQTIADDYEGFERRAGVEPVEGLIT